MFHITHRYGECETDPSVESFGALYDELSVDDEEHPDVSVQHETAWSLSAFAGGLLVWENVEAGVPRYMRSVSRDNVLRLWRLLATGDISAIDEEPWLDGYG